MFTIRCEAVAVVVQTVTILGSFAVSLPTTIPEFAISANAIHTDHPSQTLLLSAQSYKPSSMLFRSSSALNAGSSS